MLCCCCKTAQLYFLQFLEMSSAQRVLSSACLARTLLGPNGVQDLDDVTVLGFQETCQPAALVTEPHVHHLFKRFRDLRICNTNNSLLYVSFIYMYIK